jgi:hypothetical protein
VVNSKAENPQNIDKTESPPGLVTVGFKTATLSLDSYSFETVEMFKDVLNQRMQAQNYQSACQGLLNKHCPDPFQIPPLAGGNMKLYMADLTFDNLPLESSDPEINGRNYYNQLPTTFYLSRDQVDSLIKVGGWLLRENPNFKKFLENYDQ